MSTRTWYETNNSPRVLIVHDTLEGAIEHAHKLAQSGYVRATIFELDDKKLTRTMIMTINVQEYKEGEG